MKRLRPRYLALRIEAEQMPDSKELVDAIWGSILKLYGEYGASKVRLSLISHNTAEGFAVIKTVHTALEMVRTALVLTTKIQDKPIAIHVTKISGTIKSLKI